MIIGLAFDPVLAIILILLKLTFATEASETFIKVTKFQVPLAPRIGETIRIFCHYELSGEILHAMKLFKDDKEFYRFMPSNRAGDRKMNFPVDGVYVDILKSNDKEVYLRNVNKLTSGTYKCQVSMENSFKSVSATRRLEIRDRLPPESLVSQNVAGVNSGYLLNSRQQQQRHAAQHQHQHQHQRAQSEPVSSLKQHHHRQQSQTSSGIPASQQSVVQQQASKSAAPPEVAARANPLLLLAFTLVVCLARASALFGLQ